MRDTEISESLVKQEFYKSTERFNVITSWIGLFLNIIWCISDYYIINEYFVQFLLLRIAVSSISGLLLMLRKIFNINIYVCIFVLALGISVQNAYMWSVMDIPHFQKHAFAYMVLFIGVGMLVLWEQKISIALVVLTIIANIVFYLLNSHLSMNEFLINGGLITLTVLIFCVFQIRTRYRFAFNDIRIRLRLELSKRVIEEKHAELVLQKIEIQNQKDRLEVKNRETTDSINYAKNIQDALLPTEEDFKSYFKESFVFFKPKDIVSGDFYWIYEKDNLVFYATADCTGHGVPGGFMTMLGLSFLDDIIEGQKVQDPALALDLMRDKIISALNQTGNFGESKDGMDLAICKICHNENTIEYAGAMRPLWIVEDGILTEVKADKIPIGTKQNDRSEPIAFNTHVIPIKKGTCYYIFTDGYADQFGGTKDKKYSSAKFKNLLIENSKLDFQTQENNIKNEHLQWKDDNEQVDDILVIGFGF
jgi:serine phosphatase RsbU (regulator of sigma subunit)